MLFKLITSDKILEDLSNLEVIMQDYHIHSNYSGDSNMPMLEACEKAINLGLKEITFTDHVDLDWPGEFKFEIIDITNYLNEIESMQKNFSNISIKKGIEMGIQPHTIQSSEDILTKFKFDYVIASVHCVDNLDIMKSEYYNGKSVKEAYRRYFEEVLYAVTHFNNFCILGHIDMIRRYIPDTARREINYNDFSDVLDEVLINLVKKNKGLEVNTSGLRYGLDSFHPTIEFIKRFRELGGEIITIGSDAHNTDSVGYKNK
jgi:histidinol-phosphatase (PHP family)